MASMIWERMPVSEKSRELPFLAFFRGDGGIRTLVPRRANAFRVRPVMTASIRLRIWTYKT